MSGQQRKFDHDEARTLYATGRWTKADLARSFGVTSARIGQIVDPELQARAAAASLAWSHKHYKTPCRQCGTPVWKRGKQDQVTGLCRPCFAKTRETATHGSETMYSRGCRCTDCRHAATEARARRRARTNNNQVQHQTGPDASLLEDRGTGARGGQA